MAVGALMMALGKNDEGVLYGLESNNWPGGQAWQIMKRLARKYSPQDGTTALQMEALLGQIAMDDHEDPITLSQQIAKIQAMKPSSPIPAERHINILINKAPAEYKGYLMAIQSMKGAGLTPEDVEDALSQYYRQTVQGRGGGTQG